MWLCPSLLTNVKKVVLVNLPVIYVLKVIIEILEQGVPTLKINNKDIRAMSLAKKIKQQSLTPFYFLYC